MLPMLPSRMEGAQYVQVYSTIRKLLDRLKTENGVVIQFLEHTLKSSDLSFSSSVT
jgi:hypothetical protein